MKIHTTKTKASIALAAIRGEKISKLSGDYSIHPNVITKWKNIVEDGIETLFCCGRISPQRILPFLSGNALYLN